jgi:hypothetical protein
MKLVQASLAAVVAGLLSAGAAGAADTPVPPNYGAAFLGTTVAYRPPGGPFSGFQKDATGLLGLGRYVTSTIALELDFGPTFVEGEYASFGLVPGVVWSFSPRVYAAARFLVVVDPEVDLALFPGVGVVHTFANGISPLVEVNLASFVTRGRPDFGVAVTVGVLFAF